MSFQGRSVPHVILLFAFLVRVMRSIPDRYGTTRLLPYSLQNGIWPHYRWERRRTPCLPSTMNCCIFGCHSLV